LRPCHLEATSNAACPLTWGDTDWVLLADHGAYLPARDTLLVADTHFGKASIFAQAGIPAPAGVLRGTLERIDRMLAASGAGTLIVLGDLWHGRLTEDDPARAALAVWRRQRPGLTIRVVLGNHDRGSAGASAALDMEVSDQIDLGALRLQHAPAEITGRYVVAGHVHPVVRVPDLGKVAMRLPCFHLQPRCLTLPAAGAFTGGQRIQPQADDRIWVCGPGQIRELLLTRKEKISSSPISPRAAHSIEPQSSQNQSPGRKPGVKNP
jgi:DNA ligase-associated metallophosphoesterase